MGLISNLFAYKNFRTICRSWLTVGGRRTIRLTSTRRPRNPVECELAVSAVGVTRSTSPNSWLDIRAGAKCRRRPLEAELTLTEACGWRTGRGQVSLAVYCGHDAIEGTAPPHRAFPETHLQEVTKRRANLMSKPKLL